MLVRLDHLLTNASIDDESIAILHHDNIWSYGELKKLVYHQAKALKGIGLKRRQRVAIYLPKQIEVVTSLFAISMADGVFVPINPVLKPSQVYHILNDCDVSILITSLNRLRGLDCLHKYPHLQTIIIVENSHSDFYLQNQTQLCWEEFIAHAEEIHSPSKPVNIDTDMAAILYTSGSTGLPKGVVLSHRNLLAGAESVAEYLRITAKDRLLALLPFSFDYGLSQLTTALLKGASCVLMDYLLPRDVITCVAKKQVTGLAAVPPLWIQLSQLQWPEAINTHLRFLTNSGGKLPNSVLQKIRLQLPSSEFFLMYGLTEAFRSTYLPPDQIERRPDSIGKAIPNAEVLVVRSDGSLCNPFEPGELIHRGPLVSLGYWNDSEKTAERFKPVPGQIKELCFAEIAVWSGDTVSMDEEGYLYFIERKDELIKTSGYRVSPTEIEDVIYSSGLVKEAVAIGLAHESLGQAILLIVTLQDTYKWHPSKLINLCKTLLPNYMTPLDYKVLEKLPYNANGKIDRHALKQQFADLFIPSS